MDKEYIKPEFQVICFTKNDVFTTETTSELEENEMEILFGNTGNAEVTGLDV